MVKRTRNPKGRASAGSDRGGDLPTPVLRLDPRRIILAVLIGMTTLEVLLVIGDATINYNQLIEEPGIRRFFNMAREDGLGSWLGVTQTWMAGLTAGVIYLVSRHQDLPRWQRVGWLVIAVFLLYSAMDDGAQVHERIGTWVKNVLGSPGDVEDGRGLGFFPSYTWQLVFLPIFAAGGAFILVFIYRVSEDVADRLLVTGAIGLLVTAVALDFFEGLGIDHVLNLQGYLVRGRRMDPETVRHYFKSGEEFMELLANTLLWVVLLRALFRRAPEFGVRFESR